MSSMLTAWSSQTDTALEDVVKKCTPAMTSARTPAMTLRRQKPVDGEFMAASSA